MCVHVFRQCTEIGSKAISSPARGSDEVRRRSVCWKDEEILTFNIFGDVTEARLELSMRCVAIDKQDKGITNEVFLGSSSLKVGRYAMKSLVESDAHSNFVIEGLNKVRRFSLRGTKTATWKMLMGEMITVRSDCPLCSFPSQSRGREMM